MSRLKIYTLSNCDTCRRATKWLTSNGISFEELPIREQPPTSEELRRMLTAQGGELRKLFNVSGRDYREQKLGDKLPSLSQAAAVALLASNGNVVKRPFAIGPNIGLVGFSEDVWQEAFAAHKA